MKIVYVTMGIFFMGFFPHRSSSQIFQGNEVIIGKLIHIGERLKGTLNRLDELETQVVSALSSVSDREDMLYPSMIKHTVRSVRDMTKNSIEVLDLTSSEMAGCHNLPEYKRWLIKDMAATKDTIKKKIDSLKSYDISKMSPATSKLMDKAYTVLEQSGDAYHDSLNDLLVLKAVN